MQRLTGAGWSVMTDKTMALGVHSRDGTRVTPSVDETTKTVELDLRQHPNPAKAIAIPDHLAAPLVNLSLHQTDLLRAHECLVELQSNYPVPEGTWMGTVTRALFNAALGSTMKCFQHSESRTERLDATTIFGADTTDTVRTAFDLLKKLRNKHVLHDENDWMQAIPLAIVAQPGHEPVVSDIDCLVMEGNDTAHVGQLALVVDAALAWVNKTIDAQTEVIRADLSARSYADLIALPPPSGTVPFTGSISRNRRSGGSTGT
jgi:hypothetical protein